MASHPAWSAAGQRRANGPSSVRRDTHRRSSCRCCPGGDDERHAAVPVHCYCRGGPRHRGYSGDCGRFAVESIGVEVQRAPAGASAPPGVVAGGVGGTLGAQHAGDQVSGGRTGPPTTADVGAVARRRLGPRRPRASGVRAGREGSWPGARSSRVLGGGPGGAGGWATRVRDHRSRSGASVVRIPTAGPSAHDRTGLRGAAGSDRQP